MSTKSIEILYEDNHLIAVNKPAGLLVQGDITGDETLADLVKAYIKTSKNKPGDVYLGIVHRLDRPVSGVVLFAKTSKALVRLNKMFAERETKKVYWAVVTRRPEEETGKLVHWLRKDQEANRSKAFNNEAKHTKYAELNYKMMRGSDRYTLLEVYPKTGRHHQIRVQLAKIGCTIKGDLKYGAPRNNEDASIHLHARRLELEHPVTKVALKIVANVPLENLWQEFAKMMK
ncbi:MAG: RluA family pseudouridine synthase [Flavobacteriales bacterium]|nr:RluA family pseudouridine synthase [Flavobacteriales bacterium]